MFDKIKCVIFDMDGVITETSEQHFEAWSHLAIKLGIQLTRELNEQLKGISRIESLKVILSFGKQLNRYSEDEIDEMAQEKNQAYVKLIEKITPNQLFEGVEPLMGLLKEKGIKIAIGSASKNAPMLVERLGIKDYIDYIVNPDSVENGKPAPDIFLAAANYLNVKPENCLGIEDARAGVEAILSAGMLAVGIGDSKILGDAHVVFPSMKAMNKLVQELQ